MITTKYPRWEFDASVKKAGRVKVKDLLSLARSMGMNLKITFIPIKKEKRK